MTANNPVQFRFSREALGLAREWAEIIVENATANGWHNHKVHDTLKGTDAHFLGILGEWAWCEYLHLKYQPTLGAPDRGYDFMFRGKTIDVKTADGVHKNLIVRMDEGVPIFNADILALALVHKRDVYLPGWITGREFLNGYSIRDWGEGRTAFLSKEKLRPPVELAQSSIKAECQKQTTKPPFLNGALSNNETIPN